MKKILVSDVTLRDGNHAVHHKINLGVIKKYSQFAEDSGIDILEVGHGNGIGASSLSIGRAAVSDKVFIKSVRKILRNTKLSIHSIPGFSTLEDLKCGLDLGVDIFRIGCNSTEIDIIAKQVEFCKKNKKEVWGVLMMFHLIIPQKEYLKKINFLLSLGIKTIIIMDSAGCLVPSDVKNIFLNLKKINANFGFHAHNNLGYSIANTMEAIKYGASIFDASIKGFGAGAGNAQLEILLTLLMGSKLKKINANNLEKIYKMSENFSLLLKKNKIVYSNSFVEPMNILSAKYGVFSGFSSHVNNFANNLKISKLHAFKAIGEKKLVAGQEDLIMNIMYNLKRNKITNL